ncbi:TetR/AcrR family transcriptional regulator [Rudaeicoccus suwonensis]|uniref:TetR family transcriptional regulator n=1 Tax=Rudaeicoccus suwonensis TaxID=657409 RepID=A0A561ECK9_9MICO|nr:TetR family transcriptional regulator [Rudaeicoccus suwonensis]TWE13344.1 TetR family transcriptional regulator [Rudaeicoccus suwonensis]
MSGADSTRDRIVAAATAEFAQHGIAGARVERIAKAARTSKERVYAHFGSKDKLYRFIAGRELIAMSEAVPLDPADLPGYAVRVHDHITEHPERLRLMKWGQLELPSGPASVDDAVDVVVVNKIEQLRRAQTDGVLDASWDPIDILVFVSQLATSPIDPGSSINDQQRTAFRAARRDAIKKAVQRLFPAINA